MSKCAYPEAYDRHACRHAFCRRPPDLWTSLRRGPCELNVRLSRNLRKLTTMTAIDDVFATCRSEGRLAFMPFLTAGDPDLATTARAIAALDDGGADLIEVGFPYSDPIADGPTIQASYTRALDAGVRVEGILASLGGTAVAAPRIAMVSYAIVFRQGVEKFCAAAARAGVSGLIIPDLPGTDAGEMATVCRDSGLDLIQLVAPTTPRTRATEIVRTCTGFVYCVAVAGITGERAAVADTLQTQLRTLREETDLPLAVGFGISGPSQVDPLRDVADGIIVGSGIVRRLEGGGPAALDAISTFTREMAAACRGK